MTLLNDSYEVTNPIDDDVTLYFDLATCDLIVFKKNNKVCKIKNCYG
jgi:hypothetical protein